MVGCALGTWTLPHSLPAPIFGETLGAGTWQREGGVPACLRVQGSIPRARRVPQMCLEAGSLQLD